MSPYFEYIVPDLGIGKLESCPGASTTRSLHIVHENVRNGCFFVILNVFKSNKNNI